MWTDNPTYQALMWIIGLPTVVAALIKACKEIKKWWQPIGKGIAEFLHVAEKVEKIDRRQDAMGDQIEAIVKEHKPNGGGSARDAINRIESAVTLLTARQMVTMDVSESAAWEADLKGEWIYANKKACVLFARPASELAGNNWKNCLVASDAARVICRWQDSVNDGRDYECSFMIETTEASIVPVSVKGRLMRDGNGTPLRWYGTVTLGSRAPEQNPSLSDRRHKRLLIVDDDIDMTTIVQRHLELSYHVSVANDGDDALAIFNTTKRLGEGFDAIILDCSMPRMSGEEVAREIRKTDQVTPLFFFTGSRDSLSVLSQNELRVFDVWIKGLSPLELQTKLDTFFLGN